MRVGDLIECIINRVAERDQMIVEGNVDVVRPGHERPVVISDTTFGISYELRQGISIRKLESARDSGGRDRRWAPHPEADWKPVVYFSLIGESIHDSRDLIIFVSDKNGCAWPLSIRMAGRG